MFNRVIDVNGLCSDVAEGGASIIRVDYCLAKRRLFCGFQKLKPVGFCVVCVLWKLQVKLYVHYTSHILYVHYTSHILYVHYTNISTPTSTINCNLHFYHTKYLINKKSLFYEFKCQCAINPSTTLIHKRLHTVTL